jgi:hypothetical protein|tara:strand:+ start:5879 stop:6793 length:915 start_codon:yes stop_codon:yes gene_type:complete
MASTNQSPAYSKAQGKFLTAQTNEGKLEALEEMIRECPKHKSSENMLSNLKTRYKKLKSQIEKGKKSGKRGKKGIKKEEMQAVIVGFTNSGKSSLISILTNAKPKISEYNFTTKYPEIGIMNYPPEVQTQLIEIPAFNSEYYDKSVVNTADIILILVTNLEEINKIKNKLEKTHGKKIIVLNKIDLLNNEEKRKIFATMQSKKHNFILISTKTREGIEELKEKIFHGFDKMRIYTKEHGKGKTDKPIILDKEKKVKDVAEKIFHGFSENVKETFVTGPSSKFSNQKVSLNHKLKDLDIIEFKTK